MRGALTTVIALLAASPLVAQSQDDSYGIWQNPKGSVHVRAQPCGHRMCGVVVWANEKAKADARRGGTEDLVGLILFRDFQAQQNGVWRGKVFVPDIGRTFSGTITVLEGGRLEGKGCVAKRLICKTQIWTKVK